jgi:hypothetical protein
MRPPNLTPDIATGIGRYSDRQVFNALRFGQRLRDAPDRELTSRVPGQGNFPAQPPSLPYLSS